MTDESDPTTKERLVRALRARDAQVTPSRDALSAIGERTARPSPRRRAPLAVAAAVVLVGGVIAGLALFGGDDDQPDVAVDGPTTTSTTSTTEPPDITTTIEPPPTTIPVVDPIMLADDGLAVWPRDSRSFDSMETAAFSYVTEVLGVADPILEYDCCDDRSGVAHLRAQGEGGRELDRDAATMTMVSTDGTWDIVLVETETLRIANVTTRGIGGALSVMVSGEGSGFEGTGLVSVTSACSPEDAITRPVPLGAGPDPVPFETTLGAAECPTVIVQLVDAPAADGATPNVASLAARSTGTGASVVVMRVAGDDVLNVRAAPGTGNGIVATLAPDATDISRTGAEAAIGDGDIWWEIVTPDGTTGWANSAFLSTQLPVDDVVRSDLVFRATSLVEWLDEDVPPTSPTTRPPPPPPLFSPLGVDIGGIGVYADAPSQRRVGATEILAPTVFDWNPFPDDDIPCDAADCELTVAEFLDFEVDTIERATFNTDPIDYDDPGARFQVGLPVLYTDRFATVRIELPASSDEVLDWRTYTVVFDFSNAEPEIIAIWRWGWTP